MRALIALLLLAGPIYHGETIASLASSHRTHVVVVGRVTLVKREGDGDVHIRLTEGAHFIVAEVIPQLPQPVPKLGDCVRVRGIRRFDNEAGHGWPEVHPVLQLEVLPCRAEAGHGRRRRGPLRQRAPDPRHPRAHR